MVKTNIVPLTKEEMDKLIDASIEDQFFHMLFTVAKTTGRRLGEYYGSQKKKEIARYIVDYKPGYDSEGNQISIGITRVKYKKLPEWEGGVKVKDINFEKGIMKVWILKKRKLVQDESVLTPEASRLLRSYIIGNKLQPEDYVFRKLGYRQIQNKVKYYAKKAKINHNVSMHNFRHYLISELIRMGWSHSKISKITGQSPNVIPIYDHVLPSEIKEDALRDLKEI